MLNTPFSPWPSFSPEEADAVRDVVLSNRVNYWTGQECREFEREFAAWCGVDHAIALANGTLALLTALQALRITGEVITTPFSFIASSNALDSPLYTVAIDTRIKLRILERDLEEVTVS